MLNWKAHPFLRLLLPLIIGIVLGNRLQLEPSWWWLILPFLFLPILFRFVWLKISFRHRMLYGLIANVYLISLGFTLVTFHPEIHKETHFSRHLQKGDLLIGKITQSPKKKKRVNVIVAIHQLAQKDRQIAVTGKIYVSFPDSSNIEYGQVISLNVVPRKFNARSNPFAFDFRQYQYYQNIHYQAFAKQESYQTIDSNQGNWLLTIAFSLRKRCQQTLYRVLGDSRDFGIASALVLGVKDDLSDETKEAFASTGSMHVLAVSGLHVGIVSVGLRWIMLWIFGRRKSRRWYRLVVQLAGVWFFVLLTGAGASVLRAGVMFSIVEIGLGMDRRTSIFNSIAASAFLLLSWNPFLLFQVGFQLSYLALSGIVFFQPYIYKLMVFNSSILNFFWTLTAVSIAAQIPTFPLSVYYFHQFPLSFFLSGLVVVPAATLLLPYTILIFVADFISSPLSDFLGIGLAYVYQFNSAVVFWLSNFDGLKMSKMHFSGWTVLFSFALIFTIGLWLKSRRKGLIFYLLGILTLLSLERNILNYQAANRMELAFFNIRKNNAFGLVSGRSLYYFQSDTLSKKNWDYATEGLIIHHGINKVKQLQKNDFVYDGILKINNVWNFQGYLVKVITSSTFTNQEIQPNIIYISDEIKKQDFKKLKSDTILIGPTIPWMKADEMKKYFSTRGVYVHYIKEGGLILKINPQQ